MKTLHTIYNNFAKRNLSSLRLLLVMLLTLTASTARGADYTLVTSNTNLNNGDKVIIATKNSSGEPNTGVTGQNGNKDATVSTTEDEWVQYIVGSASTSGWTLYDSDQDKYIAKPTDNHFKYGTTAGTCFVNNNGVLGCNSRYLQANGTNYRMYSGINNSYTPFYVWKVSASYTITAQSNNTNYGTVSLSGTTITATSKTGYRVSTTTPYTISPTSSATVDQSENVFTVTPTANCTITINFEEKPKYTVTLMDDTDNPLTQSTAGATITLPSREGCDGYTFAGWTKSWSVAQTTWTTTAPTIIPTGSYTPTANESLYPVYTKTETTQGTPTTTSKTYTHTITAKTWSANGAQTLNNVSWTLTNDGNYYGYDGTKGQQVGSGSNPAKSMTLTTSGFSSATKITAVRISTSGASSVAAKVSVKVGSTSYTCNSSTNPVAISATNTQYTFTGNSTGDITISWTQTSSKALYFKTIEVAYQTTTGGNTTTTYYISVPDCATETAVTLNPNGGEINGNGNTQTIQTENGTLTLPEPTRDCYTFTNWNTEENGTGESFAAGEIADWDSENTTLYAQWTQNTYTITWKNGDAVLETDNNVPCGTTPTYDSAPPTKPSTAQYTYSFNGWNPEIYAADKDQIYIAQFNETTRRYTVTFDANGHGMAPANQTVDYGTQVTEPSAPTATGYTFGGWYKESECYNAWNFATDVVTGNVTLYAQWTEKALTRYRTDCDACIPLDGATINGTYHFFPGEIITLTVTPPAYDVPYTYQWQKFVEDEWEDIDGKTATTYTKAEATIEDVGHYRCVVSSEGYCDLTPEFDVKCLQLYVYYDNKSDVFNTPLNRGAEENTATISVDLQNANYKYYFKITDGCGNWYGNTGTMVRDNCTNWSMDVNDYCGLQTTKFGTYVFNVNYSDLAHLTVSVIYPAALQEAGKEIYLDNNVLDWTHSNNAEGKNKIYYRIGRGDHNNKTAMTLVPGTANLYKVTTGEYDNFDVWHIANNGCWSDGNSIYKTNTGDDWAATQATAFETLPVTLAAVTVTPTTLRSVGGDDDNNNCEFYNYNITEGMKTWKATVIPAVGGTITVEYTHHDGIVVNNFTSGTRNLAHTCLLTITATANEGYSLASLTVNDVPFTSGNIHTLTEDAVIKATWTEKATPTFAWSAATCTAALEADNTFPTLNNPNTLPVTYTSSNTDVATIDANGNITLVATGTTTITADGAETATHKSATDNYTLKVVKRHTIKWIVNGDTDTPYETTYVVDGDALALPSNPNVPYTCEEKVFIGWTESANVNADGSDIEYVDENTLPNTDKTYYAVFASLDGDAAGDYKKVTSELSDWSGEYLIVYETSETTGVAFDGSGNTEDELDKTFNSVDVAIENATISATSYMDNVSFTIGKIDNENYYIQSNSGVFIGSESSNSNDLKVYNTPYPHQIYWETVANFTEKDEVIIYSVIDGYPSAAILQYNNRDGQKRFRYHSTSYEEPIALYRKSSYTDYTTTCVETFKVTYEANGATSGNVPVDENNYILDATVTVLGNTGNLQKTHYSFVEWNTQADGNGTSYQAGETFTITENVTLYAIWEELPRYSVTWYVNGKQLTDVELNGASTTVYKGDRITKTPPAPNPEDFCGQVFVGWTDAEMDVNDTNKPTIYNLVDEFPTASGNQTFYAVFADYVNE